MKKYISLLMLSSLMFIGAGCSNYSTPAAPPELTPAASESPATSGGPANVVIYTDSGFSPVALTVKIGATVKFQNNASGAMWIASNPHPVHTGYPTIGGCVGSTFDSCQSIGPSGAWSFIFEKAGTWRYHNHLNSGETGMIIVQP